MIGYLIKNWRLLLDIVVVVGGIIAFTLFDPFGMFSKRELKGTANLVSSVKKIGELVTAEYYGEVISSLNETFIFDIPEDTVSEKFEECFYQLKLACRNSVSNNKNLKNFLKSQDLINLRTEYNKTDAYIYNHLIVLMAVNLIDSDEDKFYKEKEQGLQGNTEARVLRRIYNLIKDINKKHKKDTEAREAELDAYINEIPVYMESAASFHYQLNKMALSNKERRRDIVFIGRGWVKAGYKFEMLDEHNFAYDKQNKLMRFYGLSPVILDKDINPWFIPENNIKGFELVDFYKKATFEEAKIVKVRCKEKLLEQANHSGIMKQAQENGEEALKNFFALLLDEPDLKVEFHPLPFQNELNLIGADTLITVAEALWVDAIFKETGQKIKNESNPSRRNFQEQQLHIFYNQLKEMYFIDSTNYFNLFSIEAAKILKNKYFVVKADYEKFKLLRDTLHLSPELDTIYTGFSQSSQIPLKYPEFITQFNTSLELIDNQLNLAFSDIPVTIEITKQQFDSFGLRNDTINGFKFSKSDKMVNDSIVYIVTRDSLPLSYRFSDLSYSVFLVPNSYSDTLKLSQLEHIEPYIDKCVQEHNIKTENPKMDSLRMYELKTILKPYELNNIERKVSLKPVHKFIDFVKKPFN